jgi:hypothetical protein
MSKAINVLLLIVVTQSHAQTMPFINFLLPTGKTTDVCLQQGSLIDMIDDDIFMVARALNDDLSCRSDVILDDGFEAVIPLRPRP